MSTSKNDDFDITWPLGPRLVAARLATGFSRKELARRAEVSDTFFQSLERGYEMRQGNRLRVNPGPEKVVRVARAVGLNPRDALKLAGLPNAVLDDLEPTASEPVEDEAYAEFEALYRTFERAWGPEVAKAAMREVYRRRDAASTASPEQINGAPESGTG